MIDDKTLLLLIYELDLVDCKGYKEHLEEPLTIVRLTLES